MELTYLGGIKYRHDNDKVKRLAMSRANKGDVKVGGQQGISFKRAETSTLFKAMQRGRPRLLNRARFYCDGAGGLRSSSTGTRRW